MKILGLPQYFYPETPASAYLGRNKYEACEKAGIETVVFVPTPSRNISKEQRQEFCKNDHKKEYMYNGSLEVNRFSLFVEGKNPLLRALRYTLCCIKQFNRAIFCTKGIDAMVLSSTPPIQGAMGAIIKKIKGYPFIYNLQDIFPDSLVGTGLAKKGGILWWIGRKIENFTYRNADRIIVISQDFVHNITAKGVPMSKVELIYNWVDENAVVDIPRDENTLFDKYNLDRGKFYITYSGNVGLTQNMDMLLEVAKELQVNEDIHFVIVGDGAYKKQVESIVEKEEIKNVTLIPFQPYEDISKVFSLGDVGLVISKPGVGANSVPSKTWSILSASRPVLANFDENKLQDIIKNKGCGIFTKAGDKHAFKEAILTLYSDRDKCKQFGANGRSFILNNLTRKIGTTKYVNVIKSVVEQNRQ